MAICHCEERRQRSNLNQEDRFASLAMTAFVNPNECEESRFMLRIS